MFGRKPKIKFLKISDVKSPNRGTEYSCGIDFYIPNETKELAEYLSNQDGINIISSNTKTLISINPHSKIMIPSGLKLNIPSTKALIFENKSGIASKLQLVRGACLIDSDYKQEVFFNLINDSNKVAYIEFGQKIIQGILINNYFPTMAECENENDLYKGKKTTRLGGFGSTGLK